MAESVKSGEILSTSSECKIGLDELFVTCLNHDGKNKIKQIQNYLDPFMNTSSKHMSIRSCLIS